uniref:Uncharacterized protein n=1 Tax=Rhizophora mucronata TaxID=61149 RepID=A0A2P2P7E1_RHIMU
MIVFRTQTWPIQNKTFFELHYIEAPTFRYSQDIIPTLS